MYSALLPVLFCMVAVTVKAGGRVLYVSDFKGFSRKLPKPNKEQSLSCHLPCQIPKKIQPCLHRVVLVVCNMLTAFAFALKIAEECRILTFADEMPGKSLKGHVIRSLKTDNCALCQIECFLEEHCVSYNCGKDTCDLNSSDYFFHPGDLIEDKDKSYRGTQNACQENQCPSNATCLNGFTDKGYMCIMSPSLPGKNDTKAIVHGDWSPWNAWSPCSAHKCGEEGSKTRYRNCTSPTPERGGDPCHGSNMSTTPCALPCTCKELREANPELATTNKAYQLWTQLGMVSVYCHMTELPGCGEGWTLVMKMEGSQKTFKYGSRYWTNKTSYNEQGGLTGLDDEETKLPTYWSTPFTKICLGMKVQGETRFLLINQSAPSLYSLIADGQFKNTSLGRDAWKSLINGSSLQTGCYKEGFNADGGKSKTRIGIVGNDDQHCNSCNSRIGFGTTGSIFKSTTCGNAARVDVTDEKMSIETMCYIFVK